MKCCCTCPQCLVFWTAAGLHGDAHRDGSDGWRSPVPQSSHISPAARSRTSRWSGQLKVESPCFEFDVAASRVPAVIAAERRPHVYIIDAQLSLCTDVFQSLCTPTNPDLFCLVVTAPLSPSEKQSSSWSSHVADLVDLHTLVADHGGVSHGAVKSYSLMGVVGRDQARRGQPVAKPVAQSVTQPMPDRDRKSHCEKDREMLARVKEFDGDDDKLLVEYQQDIDIVIGIESKLPNLEFDQEFGQELKDCVKVPRRVSRRVLRRESRRESLRAQVCLQELLRGSFRV